MQFPKLLVYEQDGRIARRLRELPAESRRWTLHEPRRVEDCVELLHGPSVFIVKLEGDFTEPLDMLQQVAWGFPETACLAISEVNDPVIIGLAWDLGARYVAVEPASVELLAGLTAAFLSSSQTRGP